MNEPISYRAVRALIDELTTGALTPDIEPRIVRALQSLLAELIATDAAWDMLFPKGQVGIGPRSVIDGAVTERALTRHAELVEAKKRAMAVAELRQQVE